ncbi:MAG: DNA mismatch repair endonuclease MutL [Bdellovibrionota bacterium]
MSLESQLEKRSPITLLDDTVVAKIAAGEVIERPSSIVKELIENSIDAFSSKIEISVAEGGMELIQIIDDGMGIPESELPLALEKNCTSKIIHEKDLFDLHTLGFRGEALASIASVSHIEIASRALHAQRSMKISAQGGKHQVVSPSTLAKGTMIRVQHLFYNTPARKKFLRSAHTEFAHIEKTIRKLALSHPHIAFSFDREGEMVFQLSACEGYKERIAQLYPKDIHSSLIPIAASTEGMSVHGFVSNSKVSFGTGKEMWMFINGRSIQDKALTKAVMEGYRTALMEHRFPMAFLFLDVDPQQIDVNVHPTKSEVRFSSPQLPFQLIAKSIAEKLKKPYPLHQGVLSSTPSASMYATPRQEAFATSATLREPSPFSLPATEWQTFREPSADPQQTPVSKGFTDGFFSSLRFLGHIDHTFLVMSNDEKLVLIDQHAAHERIQFEHLKHLHGSAGKHTQHLLTPIACELSVPQMEALQHTQDFLQDLGFVVEAVDGQSAWIRSVPQLLGNQNPTQVVMDVLDQYLEEPNISAWENRLDQMFSTMACHSAVRAHDVLTSQEISYLLEQMDRVDLTSYCPHGRPTFIELGVHELEKAFKRK